MKVILGVTGSISAYKACSVISHFRRHGHEVQVVVTKNALQFITEMSLSTLSKRPVISDMWAPREDVEHIEICKWADVLVIAPATANIMAKIAHGLADDVLSTIALAFPESKRRIIFPAMNSAMIDNNATMRNMRILKQDGWYIGKTREGTLACGDIGKGLLEEPINIVTFTEDLMEISKER